MVSQVILALALASTFPALAYGHHKPGHQIPPGQMKKLYNPDVVIPSEVEFVCLVTTQTAGDPYAAVVYTEWLPREDAEAKANSGRSFVIYHPDLNTQSGCSSF